MVSRLKVSANYLTLVILSQYNKELTKCTSESISCPRCRLHVRNHCLIKKKLRNLSTVSGGLSSGPESFKNNAIKEMLRKLASERESLRSTIMVVYYIHYR